jgi:NSS family neurotransmitter:Na+ symporter
MKREQFSSRFGIILASLGMAIGAGNIWRFPRLAGQYGGAFLLLWVLFLILWSVPILMAEFSIGKKFKQGTIGSYAQLAGKSMTWAGFFITLCTLGIAFYYSVVTGWALRYLGFSFSQLFDHTDSEVPSGVIIGEFWQSVSNGSVTTVLAHILATFLGVFILLRGIQKGLEKVNRILIPTLFVLLLVISVVALNMEGGIKGLEYMFRVDFALFGDPTIWIEALSQSAWSTGAGWGLIMTISSYSREKEDVTLNTFVGAFGNNTASLCSGMAILPAVFALAPTEDQAINFLQSGSQALTFTIIPELFGQIPGGKILTFVFFLAFFLAAFSSLLPMLELFLSNLGDFGYGRLQSAIRVFVFVVIFGFPSAWSLNFFSNQDWVWGIGLVLTGMFIAIAVIINNPVKMKKTFIDKDSDFVISGWFFKGCMYFVVVAGFILVYWWMTRGYSENPWFDEKGNWNLFDVYSNASVLTQWILVIVVGIVLNSWLYKKMVRNKP